MKGTVSFSDSGAQIHMDKSVPESPARASVDLGDQINANKHLWDPVKAAA